MLTKLDAVNYLLDVLGSSPVDSIDNLHPDVASCVNKLERSQHLITQKGYWFNRDKGRTFTPTAAGDIVVPHTVMKIVDAPIGVIQRGVQLYNTIDNTYKFNGPITCDAITDLEWDYLPVSVRNAIMYHAGVQVASIDLEDSQKAAEQNEQFASAIAMVNAEQTEMTRHNFLTSPSALRTRSRLQPYRRAQFNPNYPGGGY